MVLSSQTNWEVICFLSPFLRKFPITPPCTSTHKWSWQCFHPPVGKARKNALNFGRYFLVDTFPVSYGDDAVLNFCRKETLVKRDGESKMWIKIEAFCKRKCKPFGKKFQLHFLTVFCFIPMIWKKREATAQWFIQLILCMYMWNKSLLSCWRVLENPWHLGSKN